MSLTSKQRRRNARWNRRVLESYQRGRRDGADELRAHYQVDKDDGWDERFGHVYNFRIAEPPKQLDLRVELPSLQKPVAFGSFGPMGEVMRIVAVPMAHDVPVTGGVVRVRWWTWKVAGVA